MLAAEGTRASSPTRGGGGGAQQRSVAVPNPFVALQREITETHLQARSRHAATTLLSAMHAPPRDVLTRRFAPAGR